MASTKTFKGKGKQTCTGRASDVQKSMPSTKPTMARNLSYTASSQEIGSPKKATMAEDPLSHRGAQSTESAATEASRKAVALTHCLLFLLPLEVRMMIYDYVFNSNVYKKTHARIHMMGDIQSQHYFALLRTCRAIHAESEAFVNHKFVIRFPSPTAYATFLCGDLASPQFIAHNNDFLIQANVQVQVMVKQERLSYNPLNILVRNVEHFFGLVFIDEQDGDGTPSEALRFTQFAWGQLLFKRRGATRFGRIWN